MVFFANPSVSRIIGFHCLFTDNFPVCVSKLLPYQITTNLVA